MTNNAKRLVPYKLTEPGWEALYTGERRKNLGIAFLVFSRKRAVHSLEDLNQ